MSRRNMVIVVGLGLITGLALFAHRPGQLLAPVPATRPAGATTGTDTAVPPRPPALAPISPPMAGSAHRARDPGEWQGMLVDAAEAPYCDAIDACGLARACVADTCQACTSDAACASGEVCVLDHCVLAAKVECRVAADCAEADALCTLTGYSPDPRGNAGMRAECTSRRGGRPQREEDRVEPVVVPAPPRPVQPDALLDSLALDVGPGPASP